MRIFLAIILSILAIPCALAQKNSIDSLASQMADALNHAKAKTVVVFDLVGPANKLTALGQKLSADFRSNLGKSGTALDVVELSKIQNAIRETRLAPSVFRDPDLASWLAQSLSADASISGSVSFDSGIMNVSMDLHLVKSETVAHSFKAALPLTEDMKALGDKSPEKDYLAGIPIPGEEGYSNPKCVYCPTAHFSDEAVKNALRKKNKNKDKFQGKVTLTVEIGEDGRAHDIKVIKALPYGLTDEAIKAVQSWTLDPVIGPDGKPAAVRQIIEITFHLY